MKQLRSTLLLLLIALLGGAYIYFNERGPAVQEGNVVLLRAPRNEVQSIVLSPANIELKHTSDWQVRDTKTGLTAPADSDAIKPLLDSLELVQSDAPVEGGANLKEYGLEKPNSSLKVDGQTLQFGTQPSFDKARVYAKAGDKIALVPTTLSEATSKTFDDWRDKAILRFDAEKADSFALQTAQLNAAFRKNETTWKLEKPLAIGADADTVSSFLSSLSTARTTKWLDEKGANPKQWGLDKPTAAVTVGTAKLEVGKAQTGGYAARNSTSKAIFLLPDTTFALFNRPLKDWRDKKVAHFEINSATRLRVTSNGQTKVLVKNGDNWQLEGGQADTKIHGAGLDSLAFANDLRAQDFIDTPPSVATYGLDKPALRLEITADSNLDLRFGRAKNQVYARIGTSGTIFVLNGSDLDATKDALDKLFPRPTHDSTPNRPAPQRTNSTRTQ